MNDKTILKTFDNLVKLLNDTKGTNTKLEILQHHQELLPLIKRIWDPDTKTGVTKKGIEDFESRKHLDENHPLQQKLYDLYDLFDNLTSRQLTGDIAKSSILLYCKKFPEYKDLILRIMEKKPRIRMGETLLLRAFPGIFKIFKVALAEEYTHIDFKKEMESAQSAFMSKKIDGVRLITFIKDNKVKFFSRAGREWTSLDILRNDIIHHVVPWLNDAELKVGIVFDGELVALINGQENFKETVSQSRKKEIQMIDPQYKIFDILKLEEFEGLTRSPVLSERYETLKSIFKVKESKHCEVLEQFLWSKDAQDKFIKEAKKKDWEGIMIRFNQPYEGKRTKKLLKYKFFQTEEFKVENVVIVNMPFPNDSGGEDIKPAIKSVIIKYKNCKVSVGSGFSAAERLDFAKDSTKIIGKLISVTYQEPFYDEKKQQYSLRCPIYKLLIGDTREF